MRQDLRAAQNMLSFKEHDETIISLKRGRKYAGLAAAIRDSICTHSFWKDFVRWLTLRRRVAHTFLLMRNARLISIRLYVKKVMKTLLESFSSKDRFIGYDLV